MFIFSEEEPSEGEFVVVWEEHGCIETRIYSRGVEASTSALYFLCPIEGGLHICEASSVEQHLPDSAINISYIKKAEVVFQYDSHYV
jgi:hypothetical protein